MNIRSTLAAITISAGLCGHVSAATAWITKVPDSAFTDGWVITDVQASAAELYIGNSGWGVNTLLLDVKKSTGTSPDPIPCSTIYGAGCLNGKPPNPLAYCSNQEMALASLQGVVGLGFVVPKGVKPLRWAYICMTGAGQRSYGTVPSAFVVTEAPVSCSTANVLITIRGRVGERAKATTNLSIQCDSPATVRLTLSDGGLVSLGGDGQVRLLFGKNGRDVLDVSGTAPLVEIEGELIKSPTTAGTYRGSSVLRLDLL